VPESGPRRPENDPLQPDERTNSGLSRRLPSDKNASDRSRDYDSQAAYMGSFAVAGSNLAAVHQGARVRIAIRLSLARLWARWAGRSVWMAVVGYRRSEMARTTPSAAIPQSLSAKVNLPGKCIASSKGGCGRCASRCRSGDSGCAEYRTEGRAKTDRSRDPGPVVRDGRTNRPAPDRSTRRSFLDCRRSPAISRRSVRCFRRCWCASG